MSPHPAAAASGGGDAKKSFAVIGAVIGAVIALSLVVRSCDDEPKAAKAVTAHRSTVSVIQAEAATRTYQKPVGTECEPFNTNGSTCEVGTGGSDWTRIDPNAPSGKYICWSPGGRTLFKEVWYISGSGQEKRYDFDNPPGAEEKPSAYRWVPVEKLHMTYGLQDAPCSYPS